MHLIEPVNAVRSSLPRRYRAYRRRGVEEEVISLCASSTSRKTNSKTQFNKSPPFASRTAAINKAISWSAEAVNVLKKSFYYERKNTGRDKKQDTESFHNERS